MEEMSFYEIGFTIGVLLTVILALIHLVYIWYGFLSCVANNKPYYHIDGDKDPSDLCDMLGNTLSWTLGIIFFGTIISGLWPVTIIVMPFIGMYMIASFIGQRRLRKAENTLNLSKGK